MNMLLVYFCIAVLGSLGVGYIVGRIGGRSSERKQNELLRVDQIREAEERGRRTAEARQNSHISDVAEQLVSLRGTLIDSARAYEEVVHSFKRSVPEGAKLSNQEALLLSFDESGEVLGSASIAEAKRDANIVDEPTPEETNACKTGDQEQLSSPQVEQEEENREVVKDEIPEESYSAIEEQKHRHAANS